MDLRELRASMKERSKLYTDITNLLGDVDGFLKLLAQQEKEKISKENWDFTEQSIQEMLELIRKTRQDLKIEVITEKKED